MSNTYVPSLQLQFSIKVKGLPAGKLFDKCTTCQKAQWILFGGASNSLHSAPPPKWPWAWGWVSQGGVWLKTRATWAASSHAPKCSVQFTQCWGVSSKSFSVHFSDIPALVKIDPFPFTQCWVAHTAKMAVLNQPATGLLVRVDGLYA